MGKTTAPLLSFDASGSLAKSIVYSRWRGIQYARRHVVPANPNTADQQETRNTFSWLNNVWRYFPAEVQEVWDAYAQGQPLTGRNALIKLNLSDLRSEADLTNFTFSAGAKSGPVAASATFTPGNDQITFAATAPSLPAGWTIDEMVGAAIRQQDPQSGVLYSTTVVTDATDPYSVDMTGLASAVTYVCGAWFKYIRPDGTFAYGPAIMGTALTT